MRRLVAGACFVAFLAAVGAQAAQPRTTLPQVEQEVMCVTCGVPLAIAESPQADRERAFIRQLIAEGQTSGQIRQALIAQFGPEVVALPRAHGFNLVVYVVPVAALALLLGALAVALPRWRRRSQTGRATEPPLSVADATRLDEDLGRYER